MSIYDTGADAFRDTTKWLVAFVPIASIVAVTVSVGPRLAGAAAASGSLGDWAGANVLPLLAVAAVVIGVALVVAFGAKVLSTQPKDFTSMFTTDQQQLSDAFSAGVGAPFFLDDQAFKLALADLDAKRSAGQTILDADLTAAVATSDTLRAWALHRAFAASFKTFRRWFGLGVALIVGGIIVATATLDPVAGAIREPKGVSVTVEEAGATDLTRSTGCTDPLATAFVAVAGTWDAPEFQADGPGCRFGATWRPDPKLVEVRVPPAPATN